MATLRCSKELVNDEEMMDKPWETSCGSLHVEVIFLCGGQCLLCEHLGPTMGITWVTNVRVR
jgi:hypothetical protein